VRVLLRLALTPRPKLLDSPPMIDLFPLTPRLMRLDSSPPVDVRLFTTRLKRLDSSPSIDFLPLSKLRAAALSRDRRNLVVGGPSAKAAEFSNTKETVTKTNERIFPSFHWTKSEHTALFRD
jgi:hypothetical protein